MLRAYRSSSQRVAHLAGLAASHEATSPVRFDQHCRTRKLNSVSHCLTRHVLHSIIIIMMIIIIRRRRRRRRIRIRIYYCFKTISSSSSSSNNNNNIKIINTYIYIYLFFKPHKKTCLKGALIPSQNRNSPRSAIANNKETEQCTSTSMAAVFSLFRLLS